MPQPRIFWVQIFSIMLLLLVASCTEQPVTAPLSPSITPDPYLVDLGPDELIHLAGGDSYVSAPFALDGPGYLKTYWRQDCAEFSLEMISTNETLVEAPGGYVIFESWFGPSEYVTDDPVKAPYEYIPGEYQLVVNVLGDDCQWEVWAVVSYPDKE